MFEKLTSPWEESLGTFAEYFGIACTLPYHTVGHFPFHMSRASPATDTCDTTHFVMLVNVTNIVVSYLLFKYIFSSLEGNLLSHRVYEDPQIQDEQINLTLTIT